MVLARKKKDVRLSLCDSELDNAQLNALNEIASQMSQGNCVTCDESIGKYAEGRAR